MTFINVDVQIAYFHVTRERRENRKMYGANTHPPIVGGLFFDKCLDTIICHHPDIWKYGTGILLVANKSSNFSTTAEIRACQWRTEAMNKHIHNNMPLEVESFGFFVRKSLEYRNRLRSFIYETEQEAFRQNEQINQEMFAFNYIDYMSPQVDDFYVKAEQVSLVGFFRHGNMFEENQLTKSQSDLELYEDLKKCARKPTVNALKDFLVDTYPGFFVEKRKVVRKLSFDLSHFVYSKEQAECVVCFEEKKVVEWPCNSLHITCEECAIKIIKSSPKCPLCRKKIYEEFSPFTPFLWQYF